MQFGKLKCQVVKLFIETVVHLYKQHSICWYIGLLHYCSQWGLCYKI